MCRVFWRDHEPWVLVRLSDGVMRSLPWQWTDLPVLPADEERPNKSGAEHDASITLLSPTALRDLRRLLRNHRQRVQTPVSE